MTQNVTSGLRPPCSSSFARHEAIDKAEQEAYAADAAKEERQQKAGNAENRTRIYDVKKIACAITARVGLVAGARRGEILALTWEHLDLDAGTMQIVASLNKTDGIKAPKTKAGVRTISLDKTTVESLKHWKSYQAIVLARIDKEACEATPVFTNGKGDYIDPSGFSRWWRKFKADNNFPDLRFHELRHTQVTVLLANSVDVKTVQTRLGHANASITLNLYAHAVPQNDRAAADLVGNLFSPDEGQKEEAPLKKAV